MKPVSEQDGSLCRQTERFAYHFSLSLSSSPVDSGTSRSLFATSTFKQYNPQSALWLTMVLFRMDLYVKVAKLFVLNTGAQVLKEFLRFEHLKDIS